VGDAQVKLALTDHRKNRKKMKRHADIVGLEMVVVAVVAPGVIAGDRSIAVIGNRSCAVSGR
jgi:hypothetical protein